MNARIEPHTVSLESHFRQMPIRSHHLPMYKDKEGCVSLMAYIEECVCSQTDDHDNKTIYRKSQS